MMTNHIHLLLETSEDEIGRFMKCLNRAVKILEVNIYEKVFGIILTNMLNTTYYNYKEEGAY